MHRWVSVRRASTSSAVIEPSSATVASNRATKGATWATAESRCAAGNGGGDQPVVDGQRRSLHRRQRRGLRRSPPWRLPWRQQGGGAAWLAGCAPRPTRLGRPRVSRARSG